MIGTRSIPSTFSFASRQGLFPRPPVFELARVLSRKVFKKHDTILEDFFVFEIVFETL